MNIIDGILYTVRTLISVFGATFFTITGTVGIAIGIAGIRDFNTSLVGMVIAIFSLILQRLCIKLGPLNKYEEDW